MIVHFLCLVVCVVVVALVDGSIHEDIYEKGLEVRIWTPWASQRSGYERPDEYIPDARRVPVDKEASRLTLKRISEWLWDNNEYAFRAYVEQRIRMREDLVFVSDVAEADLCFPACDGSGGSRGRQLLKQADQHVVFEVAPGKRDKFLGCGEINLFFELECGTPQQACQMVVPYSHGIQAPSRAALASPQLPWRLNTQKHLLCFVGGVWRGVQRQRIYNEFKTMSEDNSALSRYESLFYSPFAFKDKAAEGAYWATLGFYEDVWNTYSSSVFSWQPSGDTPTRRGFFDSVMLGCIPVVSQASAYHYMTIFNGFMFDVPFDHVAIVMSDADMQNADAIMARVQSVGQTELEFRQEAMARFAKYLQYGHRSGFDALVFAFGAAQTWNAELKTEMCDSGKIQDRAEMKADRKARHANPGAGNNEQFAPKEMCEVPCEELPEHKRGSGTVRRSNDRVAGYLGRSRNP